ncbi:hypothetical protein SK128_003057, partial [Halocaridina rubra]
MEHHKILTLHFCPMTWGVPSTTRDFENEVLALIDDSIKILFERKDKNAFKE